MNLTDKYRAVFSQSLGVEVLTDILKMTHFGCTLNPDNPAQIAEYNVGISILAKFGAFIYDEKNDRAKEIVRAIINIPMPVKANTEVER